ncbi:hypothetical protein Hanom_Chr11g01064281 [Helianthus anomalus]
MTTRSGGLKLVLILSFRIFKASSASLKNSWSTIMTADDECSRRKPIVEAFRRMLTAFRTAPLIGTPKWASYIAGAVAKLEISDRMVENVYTRKFYKTGGLKTYIPKNFYTKTTYSPLLSEKFGGSAAPSNPHYAAPLILGVSSLVNDLYQTMCQVKRCIFEQIKH